GRPFSFERHKSKGPACAGPPCFPSVARPVGGSGATGRASRANQEDCFLKGRSAGATLRLKPLDIGSPPFSSLNTPAMWGGSRSGARCKLHRPGNVLLLLVLPVFDEIIDDGRVGQRRGIAQRAEIVLGDLPENAAHDLARARLRQSGSELDLVRR